LFIVVVVVVVFAVLAIVVVVDMVVLGMSPVPRQNLPTACK
jgi:hypothetical protein